mgnify:CR=1 FL=1
MTRSSGLANLDPVYKYGYTTASKRFDKMFVNDDNVCNKQPPSSLASQNIDNGHWDANNNAVDSSKSNTQVIVVWRNVFIMIFFHVFAIYAFISTKTKFQTIWWAWTVGQFSSIGVLAGAHRLWSHRSYKAKWPLRLVLMVSQTTALQNDLYEWVRDHRVHHKYSETDADPHNSRRGFFFAHMGWLLCRKHPEVKTKGALVDMSDVWADPIVRFQRRFYMPLVLLFWGFIPVIVPIYCWQEDIFIALSLNLFRYLASLHHTWLVNSAAHIYGNRFYDRKIRPRENKLVAYLTHGEGYHNYHHVFPWDYSASEYGWLHNYNMTTLFIDCCAWFGLAYDRRIVTKSVIEDRISRTGEPLGQLDAEQQQRKPRSAIIDTAFGLALAFWAVILQFSIQYLRCC